MLCPKVNFERSDRFERKLKAFRLQRATVRRYCIDESVWGSVKFVWHENVRSSWSQVRLAYLQGTNDDWCQSIITLRCNWKPTSLFTQLIDSNLFSSYNDIAIKHRCSLQKPSLGSDMKVQDGFKHWSDNFEPLTSSIIVWVFQAAR